MTDELLQLLINVSNDSLRTFMFGCGSLMNSVQVRFDPGSIIHKTIKGMDKDSRLAMLPNHEILCVDLTKSKM